MLRPATKTRQSFTDRRIHITEVRAAQAGTLTRLGTGLLCRLARLATFADAERPPETSPSAPASHRARPNRCEFDYDYYVALQSRRQHQPSRLHRANAIRPSTGA